MSDTAVVAAPVLCPVSRQSPKEEIFNVITHGAGLAGAVTALVLMTTYSAMRGTSAHVIGCGIFGTTLVLMYLSSTLYHSTKPISRKQLLRMFDHMAIFLLIAGSYTPYALVALRNNDRGGMLLAVIWAIAAAGIVFKIFFTHRARWLSAMAYVAMGWLGVLVFGPLSQAMTPDGFMWLVVGGVAYTSGVAFYLWKSLPYNHGVWHLFVMAGSLSHVLSVMTLIPA